MEDNRNYNSRARIVEMLQLTTSFPSVGCQHVDRLIGWAMSDGGGPARICRMPVGASDDEVLTGSELLASQVSPGSRLDFWSYLGG